MVAKEKVNNLKLVAKDDDYGVVHILRKQLKGVKNCPKSDYGIICERPLCILYILIRCPFHNLK